MAFKERIALIDDDANLRRTLADILTHFGYEPLAYPNGQSAMDEIAQELVGVALLDLRLEDCSGLEVLRFIRERCPDTACIILTGHASQDSAIEAVNAGAYSYFLKPVNVEQLLVTIQRALEKRQADLALVESERHYQALADASPVGIFRTDARGNTTYVNPRWSVMSGVPAETAMGLGWLAAVHPGDRARLTDGWPDVIKARQASVAEYRFLRPDGSVAWVIGQALPEFNITGQFIGYIGTITDITARKQIEDALHRSEAQYRLITDHVEDIVWQLDQNLRFIYVSPAAEHVLGYTPEEACRMDITHLFDEDGLAPMRAAIQTRLTQRPSSPVTPTEYRMKHKDGHWVEVEVVSAPVYNLSHQVMGFVGVTRDVTERKRIEKTLLENEQRIKRLFGQQVAINQLALALGESLELAVVYETIYHHIHTLADAWGFVISSYNEQSQSVRAEYAVKNNERLDVRIIPPLALEPDVWSNPSQVIRTGQPLYIADLRTISDQSRKRYLTEKDGPANNQSDVGENVWEEALSALYIPMKAKGRNIGLMQVQSCSIDAYCPEDIQLLTAIANVAGVAIQNASLHSEMQRELDQRKRTQEQLRLQGTALQAAANAIVITNVQGTIEWVNPAFAELTGYSLQEVAGQNPRILKSDAQDQAYYKTMWDTILAGQVWHDELINRRKDGSLYTEEMTITPLADENGHITHFISVKQDISERKQAETAIKRHLADLEVLYENGLKLARIFERQEIAQCIIDLLEQQLHWHHAVLRLYHAESDALEVLGFSHTGLKRAQLERERKRLKAAPIRLGVGLTGWAWQHGRVVRSGNVRDDSHYLETYTGMQSGLYVPITVADRVMGVISVESEQPDAFTEADERLLVTLAAQAAAAFDNARLYAETVHRLEELDTLVQVSAAMRTAPGKAEMLPVILEQTEAILHAAGAAIAFRQPAGGEIVYELGIGDLADVTHSRVQPGQGIAGWVIERGELYLCQDVNTDPLYHPPVRLARPPRAMAFAPLISQNQVIGVLLVGSQNLIEPNQVNLLQTIANIAANAIQRAALYEQTLNYAAELEQRVEDRTAELRTTNAALERASRSKDEFLASMSHELRTPLTGILNLSEVLQEQIYGPLNEKQLHYAHIIEESGRHLLGLINDILDLSKIEAGQFDLQLELVQLDAICQACLQLTRGLANKKNQPVNYSIFPPDITLQADPRRLKQMLVNLLSNAVKFTPPGGKIGLDVTGDVEAQVIHITVWDTGIGIAQEDFSRLFHPFSQLDGSLSRQHEGTGLGLAIAQRLADKHGGGISIESTPGQGSRFTIHIPWVKKQLGSEKSPSPPDFAHEKQGSPVTPAKDRHAFRLLLADDNQVNVEIYAEYLRQNGYQVILAENGQDALNLVHQERPHLILMDIQMPGMDGLTAIQRLRALDDAVLARTPVIALTALAMPGDRERCLQAGANDYLGKPVSMRDLLRVIQTHLK